MVKITLRNFLNGETDEVGPFDHVQLTYHTVRVENASEYDHDVTLGRLTDGIWLWGDGSEWTDLVVTAA